MFRLAHPRAHFRRGLTHYARAPSIAAERCRFAAVAATLACAASATADTLYYADIFNPSFSFGALRKVAPSGDGMETLIEVGSGLRGVAVDQAAGHMYFTLVEPPSIQRCNLDGAGAKTLISTTEVPTLAFPFGIALDLSAGKMYWADLTAQQLWRANLDGSDPQPLHDTPISWNIALDKVNDKIYWSTALTGRHGEILRSNIDGSDIETVVSSTDVDFKPAALALDVAGGKIYWTDFVVDVVRRANLDGTDIQTLYTVGANNNPNGIVLDLVHGKVYWGQDVDSQLQIGSIMRMDLDGASPETVLVNAGSIPTLFFAECAADIAPTAGNAAVNVDDLLSVINTWGPCVNKSCPADVFPPAGDGVVDERDLVTVMTAWGQCP